MSAFAHSLLIDHFPGQYQTQSRGDVIIKVSPQFSSSLQLIFKGKGVMETFWILGKTSEGSSVYSRQSSPRTIAAVQMSPQESVEQFEKKSVEAKSVDDYDLSTIHTEPLYRHYSRQATTKLDDI